MLRKLGTFIFLLCVLCYRAYGETTWMPDENLQRVVREKLGVEELRQADMLRLWDIVSFDDGVVDLRGLEHAVNMDFLHISGGEISDLTPLAHLKNLRTVKLYNQNISDLTPLAGLINLEVLEVYNNPISDLSPLASLGNLTALSIVSTPVSDFSPLYDLPRLKRIQLTWSLSVDVATLRRHLEVVEIPDQDLRQAVRKELRLPSSLPITHLQMLKLEGLQISEGRVRVLNGLEHATNLKFFSCQGHLISDLSPLSELILLKALYLGGNEISDLTPLIGLVRLETLHLWGNQIVDVSPLAYLMKLKELFLERNRVQDFLPLLELPNLKKIRVSDNPGDVSPLLELDTTDFGICDVLQSPVVSRIENREYPSVFAAWANIINIPTLSDHERLAYHDLYFCCPMLGLWFVETKDGVVLAGDIEAAIEQHKVLKAENPNLILLVAVNYYSGIGFNDRPEDWPHWLRDRGNNRVYDPWWDEGRIDFTQPETQQWVIQHAIAVSKCGLFDGIFFDHWSERPRLEGHRTLEEEHVARDNILEGIRAAVSDDFLIMVNTNREKIPRWASYINGAFMETLPDLSTEFNFFQSRGYTTEGLMEIESTLLWSESDMREPRINGLEGWGLAEELPDSPRNQQWMRLFTAMALTHSDGYVLYTLGNASNKHEHPWSNEFLAETNGHKFNRPHSHDHDHYWYSFWDAELGQPIGEKAKTYRNREGLFIREFTNGWTVYNRSGKEQRIQLPEQVSGVANGIENRRWHTVPDLDGEIYLKAVEVGKPADLNSDGVVNILDLVILANAFGKDSPDLNADGVVNILDLVVISNALD